MDYKSTFFSELFEQLNDSLYYPGYTQQMREENPERYEFEYNELQKSTTLNTPTR